MLKPSLLGFVLIATGSLLHSPGYAQPLRGGASPTAQGQQVLLNQRDQIADQLRRATLSGNKQQVLLLQNKLNQNRAQMLQLQATERRARGY